MGFSRWIVRHFGKKRLPRLLEHYEPVGKAPLIIEAALKEYATGGGSKAFAALCSEIDTLEGQADKIKRRIRNHLPRSAFFEVDKVLYFNYTRSQDNILDCAQEALSWLGMRRLSLPPELLREALEYSRLVAVSVGLLRPALVATISLVYAEGADRAATKKTFHRIRLNHLKVSRGKRDLLRAVLECGAEFENIYQYVKCVEHLHEMSHNAEACADVLRAMIAR